MQNLLKNPVVSYGIVEFPAMMVWHFTLLKHSNVLKPSVVAGLLLIQIESVIVDK